MFNILGGTYEPVTGYSEELCCLVDKLLKAKPRLVPFIGLLLIEVKEQFSHGIIDQAKKPDPT